MQQYKGTIIRDLDAAVSRAMPTAEQIERGNELAKLKKVPGQFWNTPGAAASVGFPYVDELSAQLESIPEHRAILIRAYQQRDATGPAILIGYSHAERCYIYKEATQ